LQQKDGEKPKGFMTIEKLREALGEDGANATDEELLKQYELIKSVCSIVVEDYLKERGEK